MSGACAARGRGAALAGRRAAAAGRRGDSMSTMGRIGTVVATLALAACAKGMDEDLQGGVDAGERADAAGFPDAGHPDDDIRPDAAPAPDSTPVAAACTKLDSPATTL